MQRRALAALTAAVGMGLAGGAQATLFDRGGGLIYDDVLNITWLQDANFAKTSLYDSDGLMTWNDAKTWAANLVYGSYDDWRLPKTLPINGVSYTPWQYWATTYDGLHDTGLNIISPQSEMAYMYYVNLGLKGLLSSSGNPQSDFGVLRNGTTVDGQADIGLIRYLRNWGYHSETEFQSGSPYDWRFYTHSGGQNFDLKSDQLYAWAVRDGDVRRDNGVPEPGSLLLAGLALAGVMAARRRV